MGAATVESGRHQASLLPPLFGPREAAWNWHPLLECAGWLASHSTTVSELRQWLASISAATPYNRAPPMLAALEAAMVGEETRGPSHSFELDGESSGILGPGDSRWPFNSGYAVATWVYVESFSVTEGSAVGAAAMAAAIAAAATAKVRCLQAASLGS